MIEQSRLLTLKAAHMMDTVGNKAARQEIAMIKVVAPNMAQQIVDWAIQVFGGGGTSNDHFLAAALATTRLLRLADGPDEVHRNQIGRLEIRRYQNTDPARTGGEGRPLSYEEAESWSRGGLWPNPESPQSLTALGAEPAGDGMSQFVQRRDIDFLLHEVFDLETLLSAPRYRAHDRESISAMLDSAENLARKHFLPIAALLDANEPKFVEGRVEIAAEARDALRAHAEAGFFALGFDEATAAYRRRRSPCSWPAAFSPAPI